MKDFELINKLNIIYEKEDICEIRREKLGVCTIEGIPIKYNNCFLVIAYNYDFEFDGFKIIRLKDITNIKYDDVDIFISNIIRKENISFSIENILNFNIISFVDIFKEFLKVKENIIIECEEYSEFYIGRILDVLEEYIMFLNFDGEARWDKTPSKIYYNDITSITFRNRYLKFMSKYTHY